MPPRGTRLACSLRSGDGCQSAFDVYPGEQPGSVGKIEPVNGTSRRSSRWCMRPSR
ncbi:MAG TPA: hypothetical protein VEG36_12790 [Burkholderiales bacterium]|nr:hypothetical protein [Burkholderiales bacterium]